MLRNQDHIADEYDARLAHHSTPVRHPVCPDHTTVVRWVVVVLNLIEARLLALTVFSPDGHLFQVFLGFV